MNMDALLELVAKIVVIGLILMFLILVTWGSMVQIKEGCRMLQTSCCSHGAQGAL